MKTFYTSSARLVAGMALAGVLLAACTLPANNSTPAPLPTDPSNVMGEVATNAAATVAAQFTQTAVAFVGAGGADATATPEGQLPPPTQVIVDPNATLPPPPTQVMVDPNATVPPPPTEVPPATPLPPVGAGCANPYEVKAGDWIYKIARTCNVLPKDIIAANPGINADLIYPGQKLNMPAPGATPVKLCSGTYTIKAGDTLFRIAYNCGLTVEELATTNNLTYPYLLKVGQVINYP